MHDSQDRRPPLSAFAKWFLDVYLKRFSLSMTDRAVLRAADDFERMPDLKTSFLQQGAFIKTSFSDEAEAPAVTLDFRQTGTQNFSAFNRILTQLTDDPSVLKALYAADMTDDNTASLRRQAPRLFDFLLFLRVEFSRVDPADQAWATAVAGFALAQAVMTNPKTLFRMIAGADAEAVCMKLGYEKTPPVSVVRNFEDTISRAVRGLRFTQVTQTDDRRLALIRLEPNALPNQKRLWCELLPNLFTCGPEYHSDTDVWCPRALTYDAYEHKVRIAERIEKFCAKLSTAAAKGDFDVKPERRAAATDWEAWLGTQVYENSVLARFMPEPAAPQGCVLLLQGSADLMDSVTEGYLKSQSLEDFQKRWPAQYAERPAAFLNALVTMPRWLAHTADDTVILWRAVMRTALVILAGGAVMPVPVENGCGSGWPVIWLPQTASSRVKNLIEQFASLTAPWADRFFGEPLFPHDAPDAVLRTVMTALSIALGSLVHGAAAKPPVLKNLPIPLRPLVGADLWGAPLPTGWSEGWDHSAALSFYAWPLALLSLSDRPALRVRKDEGGMVALESGLLQFGADPEDGRAFRAAKLLSDPDRRRLEKITAMIEPLLAGRIGFPDYHPEAERLLFHSTYFADFLETERERLAATGVAVSLPKGTVLVVHPTLAVTVDEGVGLSTHGLLDRSALSDFNWEIAVGDLQLSREEIQRLIEEAGHLVSYGETFLYLAEDEAFRIRERIFRAPAMSAWEKLRAVLSGRCGDAPVRITDGLKKRLEELFADKPVPVPEGLAASLRPYQVRGYEWLMKNLRLGLGSLLADDMGLGKTVQVIAAILQLKNDGELEKGRVMVVAPASVLVNWQREVERFAPTLTVSLYHGMNRSMASDIADTDVVITSYALLRRDAAVFSTRKWRLLVLDEAQAVKNATTSQSEAARFFPADQVIAMTGTPVENRLLEYWSILSVVQPGLLGSRGEFVREYAAPIEERADQEALQKFRRLTTPFIMRRVKTDKAIIADLPEKNVIDRYTTITPEQAALYAECLKLGLTDIQTLSAEAAASGSARDRAVVRAVAMKRRGRILRMIMHLKQIVNSPSQFKKTFVTKPDSGKAEDLMELLHESLEGGNKVLLFTQFREMGERLQRWIEQAGFGTVDFLHGGVPVAERQTMTDRFQSDPSARILILTLKAGGIGLNLTAANVVIHYDLWWNPAVENQATDRAYRIGQRRDVMVYRFITAGTFEEKIDRMLENKRKLADLTVATGEKWLGDMTESELEALFGLD